MIDPHVDHGRGAVWAARVHVCRPGSPVLAGAAAVAGCVAPGEAGSGQRSSTLAAGQPDQGVGGQGPAGLVVAGLPGVARQSSAWTLTAATSLAPRPGSAGHRSGQLRPRRSSCAGSGPGGWPRTPHPGPVRWPSPAGTGASDTHRLVFGRVHQLLLGIGPEGGGAGDLLDLGLRQPPVAQGLLGGREGAHLPGRL